MKAAAIMTGMLLVTAGFIAACSNGQASASPQQELVFICEDEGALVERHVGVKSVSLPRGYGSDVWEITYTDNRQVYYRHPEGETCFTEPAALQMR